MKRGTFTETLLQLSTFLAILLTCVSCHSISVEIHHEEDFVVEKIQKRDTIAIENRLLLAEIQKIIKDSANNASRKANIQSENGDQENIVMQTSPTVVGLTIKPRIQRNAVWSANNVAEVQNGWNGIRTTTAKSNAFAIDAISKEEIKKGNQDKIKDIVLYAGLTLVSVVCISVIALCFLKDPKSCLMAFGSGCPCCFFCCPCLVRFAEKYLNPERIVKDNMNKYIPGVIVHDDGKIEHYEPSSKEIERMGEVIEILQS